MPKANRSGGPNELRSLLTLEEAAQRLNGKIKKRSLLTAVHRGKLQAFNIANTFYTTEEYLAAFCAASVVKHPMEDTACPAPESHPASISVAAPGDQLSGLSSTERGKLAQAQARRMLTELRKTSKPISSIDTGRVVPIDQRNSSLRK